MPRLNLELKTVADRDLEPRRQQTTNTTVTEINQINREGWEATKKVRQQRSNLTSHRAPHRRTPPQKVLHHTNKETWQANAKSRTTECKPRIGETFKARDRQTPIHDTTKDMTDTLENRTDIATHNEWRDAPQHMKEESVQITGHFFIDTPQKAEELLMAMPRLAVGNYRSDGPIKGSEQGSNGGVTDAVPVITQPSIRDASQDQTPIAHHNGATSQAPAAPPGELGIGTRVAVEVALLERLLVLTSVAITLAVIGTNQSDVMTGSNEAEALASGQGKDKLTGGRGADIFALKTTERLATGITNLAANLKSLEGYYF